MGGAFCCGVGEDRCGVCDIFRLFMIRPRDVIFFVIFLVVFFFETFLRMVIILETLLVFGNKKKYNKETIPQKRLVSVEMVLPDTLTSYPLEHSGEYDRKQPSLVLSSQGRKKKTLRYHAASHDDASLFQAFQTRSITSLYPGTETRYPFERQILAELSLSLTAHLREQRNNCPNFQGAKQKSRKSPEGFPTLYGITSGEKRKVP